MSRRQVALGLVAACLVVAGVSAAGTTAAFGQAQATSELTAPVQLTSEQDHQRLMELLHITEMRRGPDGDPTSPHAANFDESKVAPYRLPDPLVLKNGQRVTTSALWWQQRRPEIVADFDSEMYGRVPANVPKVIWQVVHVRHETAGPVPVVTKDIVGHLDNSAYPLITVDIQLTLTTPEKALGPVPVIMEFGLAAATQAALRRRFTDAQWAAIQGTGPSWQSQVLAKGWGYAVLIPTSFQADNGEGLTHGIIGLTNKGQPRKPGEWGALRAWAWGASRAVDYFETDQSVDARQIGIEGLSRYGKATLVAMAYEPRLALAFVGSSGEGGATVTDRERHLPAAKLPTRAEPASQRHSDVQADGNFGLSPDRKWLAVSCAERSDGRHDVYVVPAGSGGGGTPRKVTQGVASSYFHAWSPDSQTIAFTRGSAGKADIFTTAVTGGKESRLTGDTINDGPDYSPDGKLIYFDSERSGSTQIWRMKADGSQAEQLTDDNNINSSPHVSPDGKTVAFLSQPEAGGGVGIGDAELRVFVVNDGLIRTLTSFQGDRGSFAMYGWGDGNHLAFVSYQYVPTVAEGAR